MASSPSSPASVFSNDAEIWNSLKQVIAGSSGFQRWQLEHENEVTSEPELDYRVRRYLREALETLAY